MPQDAMGTEQDQLSLCLYVFFVSPLSPRLSICHHLSRSLALIQSSPIFSLTPTLFFLVCSLSFSFSLSHIPPLYSPFQIFYLSICFARPSTPHMKSLHLWINFSSIYVQLSLFRSKVTASRLLTMAVLFISVQAAEYGARKLVCSTFQQTCNLLVNGLEEVKESLAHK